LNWVEIETDAILHVEPAKVDGQPASSVIWVRADAKVYPSSHEQRHDAHSYFGGAVYNDYLSHARMRPPGGPAAAKPGAHGIHGAFAPAASSEDIDCTSIDRCPGETFIGCKSFIRSQC
jgi:hypothetical protein